MIVDIRFVPRSTLDVVGEENLLALLTMPGGRCADPDVLRRTEPMVLAYEVPDDPERPFGAEQATWRTVIECRSPIPSWRRKPSA